MKINTATFHVSAPSLAACPPPERPEFAFIGRSNVGKSSLVNLVTGKRDLAKVSDVPGKTRLINFFTIDNAWSLVDLPGYGFAKRAKHERADFNEFTADYLEHRENLRLTFVLIDSRLPPQRIDVDFVHWLAASAGPFVLVFTKSDKISPTALARNVDAFQAAIADGCAEPPRALTSSAKLRKGRSEVLAVIAATLTATNP